MEIMKGYVVLRSFLHDDTMYYPPQTVDFGDFNKDFEKKGLIRWVERPKIVMPKTAKPKKNVRKSKKRI